MSRPRVGALFAGYGGLDLAVEEVFGGELAWYSEIDKGALKILEHRFPGIANVGSVTEADWSQVEPVDILTGGSPCQDLSTAGRRAGMTEGTRSNLWVAMREAIAQLRPRLVIWENVRGAYSAAADSAVEPCPGCVGDGSGVHLRALGRVLGDLSELGYDAQWHGLRAADVGGAHGRFRVFVIAEDAHVATGGERWLAASGQAPGGRARADAGRPDREGTLLPTPAVNDMGEGKTVERWDEWTADMQAKHGNGNGHGKSLAIEAQRLLPTPRATDGTKGGPGQRGSSGDLMLPSAVALLPTPAVNDMGEGKTVERWDEWTADMRAKHGNGNGHGKSLAIEAQRLLPTPTVGDSKSARNSTANRNVLPPTGVHAGDTLTDAVVPQLLPTPSVADVQGGRKSRSGDRSGELLLNGIAHEQRWGDYAAAIARWESVIGRPAPEPTQTSSKGNPQLSARFVEWLMGLPAGWVTDVPGITRNEALKALGNGVVPQQAAEALRVMVARAQLLERAS